jgi:hypothetical protein
VSRRLRKAARKAIRLLASEMGLTAGAVLREEGDRWVRDFMRRASGRGFDVVIAESDRLPFDCYVNGMKVQCKQRSITKSGTTRLRLRPSRSNRMEAYLVGDFDVLAMRFNSQIFIVPADAMRHDNGETLKNEFSPSKYMTYLEDWSVLDVEQSARKKIDRQLMLFKSPSL